MDSLLETASVSFVESRSRIKDKDGMHTDTCGSCSVQQVGPQTGCPI
jgi:hypothetical protein